MQRLIDPTMFGPKQPDLSRIDPRSRMSLKLSCLSACNNDVSRASELYDFIAKDIDLPDTEPIEPSTMDHIRQSASDIFSWVSEHKADIAEGVQLVRSLMPAGKAAEAAATATAGIPPIPNL